MSEFTVWQMFIIAMMWIFVYGFFFTCLPVFTYSLGYVIALVKEIFSYYPRYYKYIRDNGTEPKFAPDYRNNSLWRFTKWYEDDLCGGDMGKGVIFPLILIHITFKWLILKSVPKALRLTHNDQRDKRWKKR